MTNEQIQKKLNQLVKLANDLEEEAKRRYGKSGNLFYEAEGCFYLMDGDEDSGAAARQSHIKFRSQGFCNMGGGAW